MFVPQTIKAVQ